VKFHGIGPSSKAGSSKTNKEVPPFLNVFGDELTEMAKKDKRVVAVTAAMREGTGLTGFAAEHPDRFFDVGIAEGHAVTFAAALAARGLRPFVAIYSTFLQRAYDMLVHDVAVQKLPVIFMLDRAGLVGEDGPTHHGVLDISYLTSIPDVVVGAPRDGEELRHMMKTAVDYTEGPFYIRYPKASAVKNRKSVKSKALKIGEWEMLSEGEEIALIAVGSMNPVAEKAANILKAEGLNVSHIDAKFVKPYDEVMLEKVLTSNKHVFVVEENNYPGSLAQTIKAHAESLVDSASVHPHTLPDRFVTHGSRAQLLAEVKLTSEEIAAAVLEKTK